MGEPRCRRQGALCRYAQQRSDQGKGADPDAHADTGANPDVCPPGGAARDQDLGGADSGVPVAGSR
jgi:hypothetical protein